MASTYPPPEHLLRDLRLAFRHVDGHSAEGSMPVVPEVCGTGGGIGAGALATLVDSIGGGLAAMAAHPNWIATADLTLHVLHAPAAGTVEARARVLRAGRTTVVIEVELTGTDGGHGARPDPSEAVTPAAASTPLAAATPGAAAPIVAATPVAAATMSFSVLPRRDANPDVRAMGDSDVAPMARVESGLRAPYAEMLGIKVVDAAAGIVEVPLVDWSRNSFGALQGGAVAAVAEAAGSAALTAAMNRPVAVTDLQLTYLALNREGPVRTAATVLARDERSGVARVELTDMGAGARRTTVASVRATPLAPESVTVAARKSAP